MAHHTIEQRLRKLERTNRILVLCLTTLILVFGYLALAGQAKAPVMETVLARELNIVNEEGKVVAHLGVRDSGAGGFWITNSEGTQVLKLNQNNVGDGKIQVLNGQGVEIVSFP